MITVIDTHSNRSYSCTTYTAVSRIVFMSDKTIGRWYKKWKITHEPIKRDQFLIYFDSEIENRNVRKSKVVRTKNN